MSENNLISCSVINIVKAKFQLKSNQVRLCFVD